MRFDMLGPQEAAIPHNLEREVTTLTRRED